MAPLMRQRNAIAVIIVCMGDRDYCNVFHRYRSDAKVYVYNINKYKTFDRKNHLSYTDPVR